MRGADKGAKLSSGELTTITVALTTFAVVRAFRWHLKRRVSFSRLHSCFRQQASLKLAVLLLTLTRVHTSLPLLHAFFPSTGVQVHAYACLQTFCTTCFLLLRPALAGLRVSPESVRLL